ncbi:hypothetical protein F4821DRAFT_276478 [Hypoxylon rubiginosum]|uniref:Uncharacterized protein n=1 Tax=Hypoxylon rubiginosum TaxID=110542 RepID=A0ACC0CII6_9PEZI|nr:hypothetical protein F4821DRAFT_276478 [Hypoxylon rubiginosum]
MSFHPNLQRKSELVIPAADEKQIQLTPRQSHPRASLESNAEELTQKLSDLKCDSARPARPIASPAICHADERLTPIQAHDSGANDSGYASLVSTPDTNFSIRSPSCLKVVDKPVPEDLKNQFLDFKILYTEALWKSVSGRKGKDIGDISMKLRYMGKSDVDARLFIVVQCERRILRKVKRFFGSSDVKETLGSYFHLHFIDSALIRLFSSEDVIVYSSSESITDTTCGTAIEMSLNGHGRRATLGGLIEVTKNHRSEFYALTAGHALASLLKDDFSEHSSDSSDESSSEASEDEDCGPFPIRAQGGSVHNFLAVDIGTVTTSSFQSGKQEGNRDWALVKVNQGYWKPNLARLPSTRRGSQTEMMIGSMYQQKNHNHFTELRISADVHVSKQPAAVITCHGIQRGTLSSNNSALLISPSNGFVETLDFLPALDSSLVVGDSGSWVINEVTGELYGHIVAVDGLGEAHVMPIHPTLQSIGSQLMAHSVYLASEYRIALHKMVEIDYKPPERGGYLPTTYIPQSHSSDPRAAYYADYNTLGPYDMAYLVDRRPPGYPAPYTREISRGAAVKPQSSTRQRTPVACKCCRRRKIRCNGYQDSPNGKCTNCITLGQECQECVFQSVLSTELPNGMPPGTQLFGAYGQPLGGYESYDNEENRASKLIGNTPKFPVDGQPKPRSSWAPALPRWLDNVAVAQGLESLTQMNHQPGINSFAVDLPIHPILSTPADLVQAKDYSVPDSGYATMANSSASSPNGGYPL